MTRARRLAAALLAATALPLAVPAVAGAADTGHTGIGIRLLDAPADLIKDPRAHSYIIDSLSPGSTITRHLEVSNDTGHRAHLLIYADAASIDHGQFSADAGETSSELTSWISVTPSSADLPQGGKTVVTVVVRVPKDATAGERYAFVLADLPPTVSGPGVKVESRVGIRVYLNVGSGAPNVDFSIDTLTAERDDTGRPVVQAQVHNIGERALDMRGSLVLDDGPGGLSAGPFPAKLGTTLAPGQSEPVTVLLDKSLPAGPWHARIVLRSGLLAHAAEGTITFPEGAGTKAAPVKAKSVPLTRNRHVLVPFAILLILALLLALLFLLWKRRRRRDDEEDPSGAGAPVTPPASEAAVPVPAQREHPRPADAVDNLRAGRRR